MFVGIFFLILASVLAITKDIPEPKENITDFSLANITNTTNKNYNWSLVTYFKTKSEALRATTTNWIGRIGNKWLIAPTSPPLDENDK